MRENNSSTIISATSPRQNNRILSGAVSESTQLSINTARKYRRPAKIAFVPLYQREAWYEGWRSGEVSITTIAQRNPGIGRNEVENALRIELDRRDRIRERVLDRTERPRCTHRFRGAE